VLLITGDLKERKPVGCRWFTLVILANLEAESKLGENSSGDLMSKQSITKRAGGMAQGVSLEFKL
jgi:hypothetical protein